MNILLITTDYLPNISGIATLTHRQAEFLKNAGHNVHVLTNVDGPQQLGIIRSKCIKAPVVRLPALYQALTKTALKTNPDVLWCTNYRGFGLPVMLFCRKTQIPYGIYLHGTELKTEHKNPLRHRILKSVCSSARIVCTNSRNSARMLQEMYFINSHVLPPGAVVQSRSVTSIEKLRAEWCQEVSHPAPVILITACRLTPSKGIETILKAIATIPESTKDQIQYIIIGDGPAKPALESIVSKLNLKHRVRFEGVKTPDEIPSFLSAADIYIQVSQPIGMFVESFGISYLEAQAVGLPCIASNWGGVPEVVKQNETGLLVSPGSVSETADAIIRLVRDLKTRQRMSEFARKKAQSHSWDQHCETLQRLLTTAACRQPA